MTVEEVTAAIEKILGPGAEMDLALQGQKVAGYVAHPAFAKLSAPDRWELMRDGFRKIFHDRAKEIGMIFFYSLEEYREIAS